MKKYLVIAIAALSVVALASTSFAFNGAGQGNVRLSAMGLQNYQTTDLGNTWRNPATIVLYKNKLFGFMGTYNSGDPTTNPDENSTSAYGGIHMDSPAGVWGVWVGRPNGDGTIDAMDNGIFTADNVVSSTGLAYNIDGAFDPTTGNVALGSDDGVFCVAGDDFVDLNGNGVLEPGEPGCDASFTGVSNPANNIDLFYGMDMGSALVGVRINYNSQSSEDKFDSGTQTQQVSGPAVVGLSTATHSTVNEANQKITQRDLGLHLGVAMKDIPIAASLLIGLPSAEDEVTIDDKLETNTNPGVDNTLDQTETTVFSEKLESDGAMNIGLYVNGGLKMSEKTTLVPTVFFEKTGNDSKKDLSSVVTLAQTAGTTTTTDTVSAKREDSGMVFGVDGAFNMKPNDKTLLVTAIGVTYGKSEVTNTTEVTAATVTGPAGTSYTEAYGEAQNRKVESSFITIPVAAGIENQTFSKLKTRMGITANLYSHTNTKTTDDNYYNTLATPGATRSDRRVDNTDTTESILTGNVATSVRMGATYKVSDAMALNWLLNKDILFSGGYLVSGIPESLSTAMSVSYSF